MEAPAQSSAPAADFAAAAEKAAATQAHLQQTLAQQKAKAEGLRKQRFNGVVFKFVTTWLGFLLILVFIALLNNLEWARPRIQEAMSESFHRQVRLGNLSWVLGLNGLAISTDKLSMVEANGDPFILSGHSEIGVAFLPLFDKRLLLKHVDFHDPEVFATQTAPGKWNFSDLLVEGPEIRFVQVEHGRLHLRNKITAEQLSKPHDVTSFTNTKWHAYDFEDVNVKLVFPQKGQKRPWPFYLSFKLPRELDGKKYTTDFSLTILANGMFNEWKTRPADIEVRAEQFNPADWRPFLHIPDGFNGLLSFNFKGSGRVDQRITGDIKCSAADMSILNGKQVVFTARDAKSAGRLELSDDEVAWSKTNISIGGVNLESEGKFWHLQQVEPEYVGLVSADLRNLADLSDSSLIQLLPGLKSKKKNSDLSGAAVVEVQFTGKGSEHHVFTSLKAENVPLGTLLSGGTGSGAPLMSLFEIEPNAPIKGQITVGTDNRILLKDVEIPAKGSVLKVRGFIDAKKKEHEVFLDAEGLSLDRFDTRELSVQPGVRPAKGDPSALMLSGKVDLKAMLKAERGVQQMKVDANLRQASLSSIGAGSLAKDIVGDIKYDGNTIVFDHLKGTLTNQSIRGGNLSLIGTMQTARDGLCKLEVSGRDIDMGQLVAFARAAHLPLPEKVANDIHGTARELDIHLVGKASKPQLTVNLSPADIKYSLAAPAGQKFLKPLQASGGNFVLTDNRLDLRNVVVTAGSSKLIVTASFETKDKNVIPKLVHVKTSAADLSEFNEYLHSESVPDDVRKRVLAVLEPLRLKGVDGKLYGDLTIRVNDRAPHFVDGILGLNNVSGKFGERGLPFDRCFGQLAFTGEDVVIQDLAVRAAGGRYTLTGDAKSFQEHAGWTAQIKGRARGQELQQLLPSQVAGAGTELRSQNPLNVQANVSGDGKSINGTFQLQAAVNDKFKYHGALATLVQPDGHPLSIDGTVVYSFAGDARSLDVRGCHITIGESTLQGSSHVLWSADSTRKPAIDFIISTPNAVPTAIVLGALMPGVDAAGAGGTLKGTIAAAGESGHLLTHGELFLSKVSIPSLRIKDVDGKIDSPRWALSSGGALERGASEAKVYLEHANIGNVDTTDLRASLKVEAAGNDQKISLKSGSAVIAGGQMTLNGFYLPATSRWHLELGLDKLQVDQFVSGMIEHTSELTGLADGKIVLESTADNELLSGLSGEGHLTIYKGSAPRLGQLHEKLSAANLLQQGIFGFNLNNVFHSMLTIKTGKFKEVNVAFGIEKGIVSIDRLIFDGTDLRLRAAGEWNIVTDSLDLDVAGNIPRVATSILPGAVGEATRNLTLQKAVRVMTFRKLENLPSLPILGDIGSDDPRAFTFKVAANVDSPDAMAKSIEKSFKWLPNKPNASAHPIPGL